MQTSHFKNSGNFSLVRVALAISLLGLLGVPFAAADDVCSASAWSAATSGIVANSNPNSPVNLGNVFVANTSGTVCALGIYAGNNATYSGPETVGLYNSSGSLLTSTTVTDTGTPYNGYYWASTAPAQVVAGDTYTVVDFTGNNGWGSGTIPTPNWGTVQYDDYLYGSTMAFTTNTGGWGPAYYGGDVMIDVPEPGSLLLFGSGLMGLAGALRRKLRKS
jgi:hypothetical protein